MHGNPFFFFNDTATTEIYTLSLHDALPISFIFDLSTTIPQGQRLARLLVFGALPAKWKQLNLLFSFLQIGSEKRRFNFFHLNPKSTRLNSSHTVISYAVFCLKKKKNFTRPQ